MRRLSWVACLPLSTMLCAGAVYSSTGLAEYEKPWELCGLCHSLDGNSVMAKFPRLAGQPAGYIEKQLTDFSTGTRTNDGGQMSAIVTEVSPADFSAIAQWFSSQPHPPPAKAHEVANSFANTTDPAKGELLFKAKDCSQCHSDSSTEAAESLIPLLHSQHAQYLSKQLSDFRKGDRTHVAGLPGADFINSLTQIELDHIVSYLATTPRQ